MYVPWGMLKVVTDGIATEEMTAETPEKYHDEVGNDVDIIVDVGTFNTCELVQWVVETNNEDKCSELSSLFSVDIEQTNHSNIVKGELKRTRAVNNFIHQRKMKYQKSSQTWLWSLW